VARFRESLLFSISSYPRKMVAHQFAARKFLQANIGRGSSGMAVEIPKTPPDFVRFLRP
jgi:hypothetical protein